MTNYEHHPQFTPHELVAQREPLAPDVLIREFDKKSDAKKVRDLMYRNFDGPSYALQPSRVVRAYKDANRIEDIEHAVNSDGRTAIVVETPDGSIAGFTLLGYDSIRVYNGDRPYGTERIRRLHVDPDIQGKQIGGIMLRYSMKHAEQVGAEWLTIEASGGSREYAELNGFWGKTELSEMPKRSTSAIVWNARRRVIPETQLYPPITHIVYAGSSKMREDYLREITRQAGKDDSMVVTRPAQEDPSPDTYTAAKSKAYSAASTIKSYSGISPLIVANDTRASLISLSSQNPKSPYAFVDRGKPQTLEDIQRNFQLLRDYARETGKPAPYLIRTTTFFHDPIHREDSYTFYDVSIWLSPESLEQLATENGVRAYANEVNDRWYESNVFEASGGLFLPYLLDNNAVAGINGYPYEHLHKRDELIVKALTTVICGIDKQAVTERLQASSR